MSRVFPKRLKINNALDFQSYYDAFWRIPIPSNATFSTFQMGGDSSTGFHISNSFDVYNDVCYRFTTNNSDPVRNLYVPSTPNSGNGYTRTNSTTVNGPGPSTFHIPDSLFVADSNSVDTPNNPTIILNTDTKQALYLNLCARPTAGGPIYGYTASRNSTHGGSYISGGEVTLAELNSTINHAVGIAVYAAKYLSPNGTGFVPPAFTADSGYAGFYGGTNVNLKMGTRLGIPSGTTAGSLGVSSANGLALFAAFKTYGAYIVDDTFWDAIYIEGTSDASSAIAAIKTEILAMFAALQIIT